MAGYRPEQETNQNAVEQETRVLQEDILRKKEKHLRAHLIWICAWCKKDLHNVPCPHAELLPTPEL
jgi:hypothetical protein